MWNINSQTRSSLPGQRSKATNISMSSTVIIKISERDINKYTMYAIQSVVATGLKQTIVNVCY